MGNLSGKNDKKRGFYVDDMDEEIEEGGRRTNISNPFDVRIPNNIISEGLYVFNVSSTDRTNELKNYGILPIHTLHKIFQYASIGDIYNIMQSCELFYSTCNTSLFWRERYRCLFGDFGDIRQVKLIKEQREDSSVIWKKAFYDEFYSYHRYDKIYRKIMTDYKKDNDRTKCGDNNNYHKSFDVLVKILLIGSMSVGKSCLLLRYVENQFNEDHVSTIGVDFKIRTIKAGERIIKLQIWDTAGQERFRTITNSYYKGTHVILLCFALDDEGSFRDVEQWYEDIRAYADENVTIIVVGTKSDLPRKVSREDVRKKLERCFDMRYQYCECSAKEDYCCYLPFGLGLRAFYNKCFRDEKPIVMK